MSKYLKRVLFIVLILDFYSRRWFQIMLFIAYIQRQVLHLMTVESETVFCVNSGSQPTGIIQCVGISYHLSTYPSVLLDCVLSLFRCSETETITFPKRNFDLRKSSCSFVCLSCYVGGWWSFQLGRPSEIIQ